MDDFKEKLVHLLHYPNSTWNFVFQTLKNDPTLSKLNQLKNEPLSASSSTPLHKSPFELLQYDSFQEQIRKYEKDNISVISIFDKEYPKMLKEIYQPPWVLFAKGDIGLLNMNPKLAVVGSRQATQYGRNSIQLIFPELLKNGVVIVSGLAKGIDSLAHEQAIKNGGKTIAVIAGGIYHIYPKENMGLAEEIMKNQLIVSEYPPGTKPERWHFPARNRIISGLSHGTFIIEAKRKSGSLITANYAVNEGRDVFSLPGSIFNPCSIGANELIQQGAKLVTCAEDILVEMNR